MNVQFVHDFVAMSLYRLDADGQLGGDLFRGIALSNQLKHFRFPQRKTSGVRAVGFSGAWRLPLEFQHPLGNARTEKGVAFPGLTNSPDQITGSGLFDQVADGAGINRSLNIIFIAVAGQDQDLRF